MTNEPTEPNSPAVLVDSESKSQVVAAVGGVGNVTYVMPDNYSKVVALIYNPTINFLITLVSQRARKNLLNGFSTFTGFASGTMPLANYGLQNDNLTLNFQLLDLGPFAALPYTVTFTLMYG